MSASLLILLASLTAEPAPTTAGTRADRTALFEQIMRDTLARQAFSPIKDRRLGLDYERDARAMRQDFVNAETAADLYYALVRLSNLRKDAHLKISTAGGGIGYKWHPRLQAPIRIAADYGRRDAYFLFVRDVAADFAAVAIDVQPTDARPEFGDKLIGINSHSLEKYLRLMQPYLRYSTADRMWVKFAEEVSRKRPDLGRELYDETVTYRLEKRDGRVYTVRLPYRPPSEIHWAGRADRKSYRGFRKALRTESFTLYVPDGGDRAVIVLDWHDFGDALPEDLDVLMGYAAEWNLLDAHVVCDLTDSSGGQRGWLLLQRLVSTPFRVTFGNLRISDLTPRFVALAADDPRISQRTTDWLQTDVRRAIRTGANFTASVPFKLRALPKDSNGTLQPAKFHFRGKLVCLLGPSAISQVDQFAAMVVDNNLGHTIGMPTGGSSNTWGWTETVFFPISRKPVVNMTWSMGHTIRPNGEILEGNPPRPDEFVPITRDNYRRYHDELLSRSLRRLEAPSRRAP